MTEEKRIYLEVKKGTRILNKVLPSGDHVIQVLDSDTIQLFPNRIYRIPINEKTLCDDDFVYLKSPVSLLEKMDIIGIQKGYAIIQPRMICKIKDGTYIGYVL